VLTVLPGKGYQLLDWPRSWASYTDFRDRWGLTDPTAIRALALGWYVKRRLNLQLWIISGRRSEAQQAALYADSASGRSSLPAAPPGQSAHESGQAFDVGADYALDDAQWRAVGALGEALGLRWGGTFTRPDPPHFQIAGA